MMTFFAKLDFMTTCFCYSRQTFRLPHSARHRLRHLNVAGRSNEGFLDATLALIENRGLPSDTFASVLYVDRSVARWHHFLPDCPYFFFDRQLIHFFQRLVFASPFYSGWKKLPMTISLVATKGLPGASGTPSSLQPVPPESVFWKKRLRSRMVSIRDGRFLLCRAGIRFHLACFLLFSFSRHRSLLRALHDNIRDIRPRNTANNRTPSPNTGNTPYQYGPGYQQSSYHGS